MDKPLPKDGEAYSGNFTVKGTLGHGGIGRVLLGFDTRLRREVAIKELIPEKLGPFKDRAITRFLREAKISGQLEHPGVVPVYEMGTKPDGNHFYVMKYVVGKTLSDALAECRSEIKEESFRNRLKLLDNIIAITEAVAYAHSRGIIHRDLKPGNIILGEFGETIILDWGLAKVWHEKITDEISNLSSVDLDEIDPLETRQGALVGTPSYMAPEQVDKKFGDVDPQTDVYSLGVILFMILTGEKPYLGTTRDIITETISGNPSPSPRFCGEFIPPELCAICEKAMNKDKAGRFRDAHEMATELKAYRDGRLVSIYAYSKMELLKRFIQRNKIALSAVAAVILAIIAGAGFSLHFAYEARQAQLRAENALVEVTNLSESAISIARKITFDVDQYFEEYISDVKKIGPADLEKINKKYPELILTKVAASYPDEIKIGKAFINDKGQHLFDIIVPTKGQAVKALIRFDEVTPHLFGLDPTKSNFQVWCMQSDGYIIYDEDPKQIGLMLFSDRLYANFPELLEFGEKIKSDPIGVSYYSFLSKDDQNVVYKVAAWDTIETLGWKIVVTHPYMTK